MNKNHIKIFIFKGTRERFTSFNLLVADPSINIEYRDLTEKQIVEVWSRIT